MESREEPSVFAPKVSHKSSLGRLKRGARSVLQVVATGMTMWSRRLQPRAFVSPPLGRLQRGNLRPGLESLDEREMRSEAIEADLRERLPTIPGEFIAPSARIIDEN